jgi:hypothetical protein
VRRREESWLKAPKLICRDLAVRTSFAIDEIGSSLLVGGTAVVPADPRDLYILLGFLNSRFANELLGQITPAFRGGFRKIEPQHLERVAVPISQLQEPSVSAELVELVRLAIERSSNQDDHSFRNLERRIDDAIEQSLVAVR